MKKYFFYLIAIAIVSVVFTSCNKDESMLDLLEQETETVNELTPTEEQDEKDDSTMKYQSADLQNWWK